MSISVLDPALVQRIAAGEVIDRPASVVRELVDNSVDAGASSVSVSVENGGLDSIIVSDDGRGISREDLELTCNPHATSKIKTLDDLFCVRTMGFRGEALYSIASCSRLTISSGGWSKTVDNTVVQPLEQSAVPAAGTTVSVKSLFERIPARRMFLKRPASETAMCRTVLIQKALAFPAVEFRFFIDGQLKLHLPAADAMQRFIDCHRGENGFIETDCRTFAETDENFSLFGVGTVSESYRSDRSRIRIFVNCHCIEDFSLVTAVTNGYSEQFPGGRFPFFCLFVTIKPELVDFNIHPAKKECRIRIKSQVQSWVTTMIRTQINRTIRPVSPQAVAVPEPVQPDLSPAEPAGPLKPAYTEAPPRPQRNRGFAVSDFREDPRSFDPLWFEKARTVLDKTRPDTVTKPVKSAPQRPYIYLGQAFRLFLIVEKDDKLLFVDQHAAHERILYDRFKADRQIQRLLIPYRFEVEPDTDRFLLESSYIYSDWGIELTRPEEMVWEIDALPLVARDAEEPVARFICENTGDLEEIEKKLFSTMACRSAIKAGDEVDSLTACAILDEVFKMEKPCCPHGRVFVTEITEKTLRQSVGRLD